MRISRPMTGWGSVSSAPVAGGCGDFQSSRQFAIRLGRASPQ
jgi:hypothetical protein